MIAYIRVSGGSSGSILYLYVRFTLASLIFGFRNSYILSVSLSRVVRTAVCRDVCGVIEVHRTRHAQSIEDRYQMGEC